MYKKFESMGARLLGRLVPKAEAFAGCVPQCYPQCWQCGYKPCQVDSKCNVQCNS